MVTAGSARELVIWTGWPYIPFRLCRAKEIDNPWAGFLWVTVCCVTSYQSISYQSTSYQSTSYQSTSLPVTSLPVSSYQSTSYQSISCQSTKMRKYSAGKTRAKSEGSTGTSLPSPSSRLLTIRAPTWLLRHRESQTRPSPPPSWSLRSPRSAAYCSSEG